MAILTSEAVEALLRECLLREGEPPEEGVEARGVIRTFFFHGGRVRDRSEAIMQLLAELTDDFYRTGGGGASFLNACYDRHGNFWTGMHMSIEELFALGIAAGRVEFLLPREAWVHLPGSMPYVVIDL